MSAEILRFSIVTATFNRGGTLSRCIESVQRQRAVEYEHIVVDGGSTDQSMDILQRRAYPKLRWISEQDSGIGDAMNKGISMSTGQWLLFLHSDDALIHDTALAEVSPLLEKTRARVLGFPIRYGNEHRYRVLKPSGAGARMRLKTGFLHQATFIHREVFDLIGPYRTDLRIAMDYEFFLRAWRRGVPMATFDKPIPTLMSDMGVGSRTDWPSLVQRLSEERQIQLMHMQAPLGRLAYRGYWAFYLAYRRLLVRKRCEKNSVDGTRELMP